MDCREKVTSEDYMEILVDYLLEDEKYNMAYHLRTGNCYQAIDKELGILYVTAAYLDALTTSQYRYTYIPKCYGLLQTGRGNLAYEETGTFRAQNPPLSLTGKEVLLGFIDTGDGVMILSITGKCKMDIKKMHLNKKYNTAICSVFFYANLGKLSERKQSWNGT